MLAKSVAMCRIPIPTPDPTSLTPGLSIAVATPLDTDLISPLELDDCTPWDSSASTSNVQPVISENSYPPAPIVTKDQNQNCSLTNPEIQKLTYIGTIGQNASIHNYRQMLQYIVYKPEK